MILFQILIFCFKYFEMLSNAQKRNLRRSANRASKNITTTAEVVKGPDGKTRLQTTHKGGIFSPYDPVTNKHGNKNIPKPLPGAPPKIISQEEITITEDFYYVKINRLPLELRKVAEMLLVTNRTAELIQFLHQHRLLPHAEDTKELIDNLIGLKVKVTIDDQ